MVTHTLHIGDYVFDYCDRRGGYVVLIGGEEKDTEITNENRDIVVTLWDAPTIEERCSEWETEAEDCYQMVEGKTFHGEKICYEHCKDELQSDYPYYCPEYDENVYEVELDN